jgi:hypothetical protein
VEGHVDDAGRVTYADADVVVGVEVTAAGLDACVPGKEVVSADVVGLRDCGAVVTAGDFVGLVAVVYYA